jgi:hypothetical protein
LALGVCGAGTTEGFSCGTGTDGGGVSTDTAEFCGADAGTDGGGVSTDTAEFCGADAGTDGGGVSTDTAEFCGADAGTDGVCVSTDTAEFCGAGAGTDGVCVSTDTASFCGAGAGTDGVCVSTDTAICGADAGTEGAFGASTVEQTAEVALNPEATGLFGCSLEVFSRCAFRLIRAPMRIFAGCCGFLDLPFVRALLAAASDLRSDVRAARVWVSVFSRSLKTRSFPPGETVVGVRSRQRCWRLRDIGDALLICGTGATSQLSVAFNSMLS